MSSTDEILEWIRANCLPGDTPALGPDSKLLETGLLDSLQVVQIVGFVEEHYGVSIDLEDLTPGNFETPGSIASLVDRLRARPGGE